MVMRETPPAGLDPWGPLAELDAVRVYQGTSIIRVRDLDDMVFFEIGQRIAAEGRPPLTLVALDRTLGLLTLDGDIVDEWSLSVNRGCELFVKQDECDNLATNPSRAPSTGDGDA